MPVWQWEATQSRKSSVGGGPGAAFGGSEGAVGAASGAGGGSGAAAGASTTATGASSAVCEPGFEASLTAGAGAAAGEAAVVGAGAAAQLASTSGAASKTKSHAQVEVGRGAEVVWRGWVVMLSGWLRGSDAGLCGGYHAAAPNAVKPMPIFVSARVRVQRRSLGVVLDVDGGGQGGGRVVGVVVDVGRAGDGDRLDVLLLPTLIGVAVFVDGGL